MRAQLCDGHKFSSLWGRKPSRAEPPQSED